MSCTRQYPEETIDAYLDGQLEPAASQEFEAHLADCEACCTGVEDQRSLQSFLEDRFEEEYSLESVSGATPPPSFAQVRDRQFAVRRLSLVPWWTALAAVAAVLLLGVSLVWRSGDAVPSMLVATLDAEDVRQLAAPLVRRHDPFFAGTPRSISMAGRLLAFPSDEFPSADALLAVATEQDRILVADPTSLPSGWHREDTAGSPRWVHASTGKSWPVVTPDEGKHAMRELIASFGEIEWDRAPIGDSWANAKEERGVFVRVGGMDGKFARLYELNDRRRVQRLFPFAPADAWFPMQGQDLLPPAEPAVEDLDTGEFLTLSQFLDSLDGRDGYVESAESAFRWNGQQWTRWPIAFLPYPRPVRLSPGSWLLVVAADQPFPIPEDDVLMQELSEAETAADAAQQLTERLQEYGRSAGSKVDVAWAAGSPSE